MKHLPIEVHLKLRQQYLELLIADTMRLLGRTK